VINEREVKKAAVIRDDNRKREGLESEARSQMEYHGHQRIE
jgi:hypothetical protein